MLKLISQICKKVNWIILYFLLVVQAISWGLILFIRGTLGVASWWFLMVFGGVGVILFIITAILVLRKILTRRKASLVLIGILALSLFSIWPSMWLFGKLQIAYPADIHKVKPEVAVRLPVNHSVLVAWGGNSLKTNYHVWTPVGRWAYDLFIPPASMKSPKLEDYGIYGMEIVAPASGTIVEAFDGEKDIKPGSEDFLSTLGNHVFIRLDQTNSYLVIAHMKQGSLKVKSGQHVEKDTPIGQAGNSGTSSEPHIHIHHQRQNPSTTSIFLSEGLPLYFRDIDGPAMPEGGVREEDGLTIPVGQTISPIIITGLFQLE